MSSLPRRGCRRERLPPRSARPERDVIAPLFWGMAGCLRNGVRLCIAVRLQCPHAGGHSRPGGPHPPGADGHCAGRGHGFFRTGAGSGPPGEAAAYRAHRHPSAVWVWWLPCAYTRLSHARWVITCSSDASETATDTAGALECPASLCHTLVRCHIACAMVEPASWMSCVHMR